MIEMSNWHVGMSVSFYGSEHEVFRQKLTGRYFNALHFWFCYVGFLGSILHSVLYVICEVVLNRVCLSDGINLFIGCSFTVVTVKQ